MRLLYYKLYVCKNGKETDYPLEKLIDTIYNYEPKDKLRSLSTGDYSLTKMRVPDQEREMRNRSFWISKYRDKKPLGGTRGTDEVTTIDKDVMETANCLVIPAKNFLAMEYSQLGCRINGFVEYLNSFLISDTTDETSDSWTVEYIKVTEKSKMSVIRNSKNIKRIDVDFIARGEVKDFLVSSDSEEKSIMEKVFYSSIETAKHIGGNLSTFTVRKGRYSDKMHSLDVVKVLQTLLFDSENITSVKVTFDNEETGKKNDYVDLKHDGQMQGELLVGDTNTGFEYISREISDFYYGEGSRKGISFPDKVKKINIDSKTIIYRMNENGENKD